MEMLPLTPERKAQLDDYARRHGQDTATALDEALASSYRPRLGAAGLSRSGRRHSTGICRLRGGARAGC